MKKYHKISIFIVLFALISALCFIPVSAEGYSYEALPISITKTWPANISYSQSVDNYVTINVPYPALANKVSTIWTCHNSDTKNYYHYKFVFVTSIIEPYNFTCTFDGVEYEVKKDYNVENTYYIEIENIKISSPSARLDFNFTFSSNTTGYLYFMAYYQYSDLNPIIDNQNENTDKIIENQNENADKIVGTFTEGDYDDWSDTQDTVDDYNQTEKVIIDVANENLTTVKGNVFDNSLFSPDNKFFKGFIAMSGVVEKFSILPGVDGVLKYSIAFGIMAFVLGLITTVVRVRRK